MGTGVPMERKGVDLPAGGEKRGSLQKLARGKPMGGECMGGLRAASATKRKAFTAENKVLREKKRKRGSIRLWDYVGVGRKKGDCSQG